jgi:hypothetical protein
MRFLKSFTSVLVLTIASGVLAVPAVAQVDLSGQWSDRYHEDWPERIPGPDPVDLLGLPLSEAGRAKADSWNVSVQTLPERQCIPHMATYNFQGPANLKIWNETDPITGRPLAWKIFGTFGRTTETIWMDGRPHPSPNALYTFEGFTTGEWEGDMLTTYTTHIKMGYIRRNGVPSSDRATVVSHIVRHGDILTITTIVEDPVYLTEPLIRSHSWELDPKQQVLPTPCEPVVEVPRPKGVVPHFLPGENPFVTEVSKLYGIPLEAVRGGAETMYPEYRKTIKDKYVAPLKCERYCCGWGGGGTANVAILNCITGGSARNP